MKRGDGAERAQALENLQTGAPPPAAPVGGEPPASRLPERPPRLTPLPCTRARPLPGAPGGRVRSYEDLDGGEGRGVFFRPQRYGVLDLAPLCCRVTVELDGAERECSLRDVSQNGAALEWPPGLPCAARGQRLRVGLRFDGYEAFRGVAHVGSIRGQDDGIVVGISFHDFLLDIDEVLHLRDVQRWTARVASARATGPRWAVAGGGRYKALLSELRLLFEDARAELGELEAQLPWHVLHGGDNPALRALVAQLRAGFVPEVVRLSEEIDGAVRELPAGHRDPAAREWSRRTVEEFLLQAPGAHRARHKPFGYPGDYEVMNFIYARPFEGATLFARAVELAFWHARCSVAVRARKDLLKREIAARLSERAATRPLRVLSIAAGPAQELVELLEEVPDHGARLEVVLFEQDKSALSHAWRRLEPLATERFPGRVRLTYLHDSIKRLLRDPRLFAGIGEFDLVYSAGLLDYLHDRTAVTLTRNLAASTAPGGALLAANMVDHPARWYLEVPLDWPLAYRTEEELLDIGARAAPGARLRILEDESGANPFLEIVPA